ncbi:hypothetical protein AO382_0697 [Moraxella catarrhalis]|uniref:Uncharacterized protein n=1 Tax=Moraxella catarrhalis TaxID=480 RepID=A0A7Z0UZD6_MORCA|nr:hypothetical protein AO382_0697 [Moraxella catarrhalis]
MTKIFIKLPYFLYFYLLLLKIAISLNEMPFLNFKCHILICLAIF